ncbi:Sporulation and spore germination [Nocardioides exalbidus]|uniref:Sporulation and spore germination n=1 Tax=Nocardioides exalbidus TaxID=402596 RepID=A0A1H4Y928_9ACTN|nr:GerMN domain-containing protein [Nocardioides exalbidus]SED14506.1 Sporulation and spore germination [Nocardioides exalbidus]
MTRSLRRAGRTTSRRTTALGILLGLGLGVGGCGLPDEGRAREIDDATVPYNLLRPDDRSSEPTSDSPEVARMVPVVFWLRPDDRLVPAVTDLSCDQATADVIRTLLRLLSASPDSAPRGEGLASAVPSTAQLTLVGIEGGVAVVGLDPLDDVDAERLPLAVGQVVLSITSTPDVDSVRFVTSARDVDVPLPGGALASGVVSPDDYVELLPQQLRPGGTGSASLGCPDG